jgi:hypothetical protein
MLHSKLRFTADVYKKETHNLLLNVDLPNYTGASEIVRNLGKMENKGLELTVGATPVRNGDWNVNFNLNFSLNRNKVLALGKNNLLTTGGRPSQTGGVSPTILKVGEPMSSFRGYIYEGVWQEDEADLAHQFGRQPGDARYKDINGDGSIGGEDLAIIGSPLPDYIWGFNSTVSYKNFDLNLVINGSEGGQIYNIVWGGMFGLGGQNRDPVAKAILNRWSPDNPNSTIPAFTKTNHTKIASTQFVQDASWVRFKNISLAYSLPSQIFNNTRISSLKLSGSVQNAISFYSKDFVGFDPSLESSTSDRSMGVYNGFSSYPIPRIITFSINLKF